MTKMLLIGLLTLTTLYADIFDINISLEKHPTDNPYGEWVLEKKIANLAKYKNKINTEKDEYMTYNCLADTNIEIIDIPNYKRLFVDHLYYKFYWKTKKKDYSLVEGVKMNNTISPTPTIHLRLKNKTKRDIKLLAIRNINLFSFGGEASAGNREGVRPNSKYNTLNIKWDSSDSLTFSDRYIVKPFQTIDIPLSIWMQNATHGDGSGSLTYAIELEYIDMKKRKNQTIMIIEQSDDEGYFDGGFLINRDPNYKEIDRLKALRK